MQKKLPTYRIFIDEEAGALVYKNSIVTNPAHGKKQYAFKEEVKKLSFEDVKQNIVGVAISPNQKIYRNDPELGEHEVIFYKEDIEQMAYVFAKNMFHNEMEYEHDPKQPSKTAALYFSYIIDREKGFNAPEAFKNEPDGTWLLGYHFFDKKEYDFAKKKGGFSVEGTFLLEQISNQFKNQNMKKNEKTVSIWKKFADTITEALTPDVKFEDVTLEDGTIAKHEGVGSPLVLVTESGEINAEDGTYTTESGSVITVLDGLISEIAEAVAEEEMEAETAAEVQEFADATTKALKFLMDENAAMKKRIEAIENQPKEQPKKQFNRVDGSLKPKTQLLLNQLKNQRK